MYHKAFWILKIRGNQLERVRTIPVPGFRDPLKDNVKTSSPSWKTCYNSTLKDGFFGKGTSLQRKPVYMEGFVGVYVYEGVCVLVCTEQLNKFSWVYFKSRRVYIWINSVKQRHMNSRCNAFALCLISRRICQREPSSPRKPKWTATSLLHLFRIPSCLSLVQRNQEWNHLHLYLNSILLNIC